MPPITNKTPEEIMPETERKRKEYILITSDYKKSSSRILLASALGAILILLILLFLKYGEIYLFSGAPYFLLIVSLLAFLVAVALHCQYQTISRDRLSDLSLEISPLAQNKNFEKRILYNRKTIYDYSIPFWIGLFSFLMAVIFGLFSSPGKSGDNTFASSKNSGNSRITIDLLQINDVYEISPLDSGRVGGMARIATLKKEFLAKNENSMLIMAGDFLSPSIFNAVTLDNEKIAGKQMIAAMNAAGVDLTIFGNHEFDIDYETLQRRINESSFQWVASNVYHKTDKGRVPFYQHAAAIPQTFVKTFYNNDGIAFKVGFLGLTNLDNKGNLQYAEYDSTLKAAHRIYPALAAECDAVIALTHQDMGHDSLLAVALPGLTAIIGGHEHNMQFSKIGNVCVTKAHSNATTAFHLKLLINKAAFPKVTVIPTLISINTSLAQDTLTKIICDGWSDAAQKYFTDSGFKFHTEICKTFALSLDGTEAAVRSGTTNLTMLIADAMLDAAKNYSCKLAIYNSGSIPINDIINLPVTEYSILRALPYGGAIRVVDIKGTLVKEMIRSNLGFIDQGGFLQFTDNVSVTDFTIDNVSIKDSQTYTVAIANYLVEKIKLDSLYNVPGGIVRLIAKPPASDSSLYDIRKAVIKYLGKFCDSKILVKYK